MFVEINPKMWYNIFIVHLEIGGIYNMVDSYKVLLLENELNAAPLGDVDNQRIINEILVKRLTDYWIKFLNPLIVEDLRVALMCEQQSQANYQRMNKTLIERDGFRNKKHQNRFILAKNGLADFGQLLQLFRQSKSAYSMDVASYTHGSTGRIDLLEELFPKIEKPFIEIYCHRGYDDSRFSFIRDDKHKGLVSKYSESENNEKDFIRKTCPTVRYVKYIEAENGRALIGRYFDLRIVFDIENNPKKNVDNKIQSLIDAGIFSYHSLDEIGRDYTFYIPVKTSFFVANLNCNEKLRSYFPTFKKYNLHS